ncbi:MAG: hypothetical protein QGI68_20560 [Pseudomonadales bacterium]|jgi:hypothetical protein|nr:hypothetical protein [Pseudomonadales bacterium]MDP7360639.1 hypothetical protein [Pseudomonadales bacterium]MDP7597939.1 hypothetical protein [Pseudomonadales bacterium]HJN51583.1 hypothetical protein [Pseudomonadales bacterium]|tara:strand:+ start:1248 stop:1754 length:507 start_codon:yes stop_codon:yes gene_type:complete
MKNTIRYSNRVAMVLGYVLFFSYLAWIVYGNVNRYHKVDPHESAGIGARRTIAESYSYRNFNGDGISMAVWAAYPSTDDIAWIVDRKHIEQSRVWFSAPFDADAQMAFDWLTDTREYEVIQEQVELMLAGEYFYSFDTLNLQGEYVQNGGMWLVSPELRLLAYLDQDM